MAQTDTHIYLDLDIINNDQFSNNDPPILRFEETRNSPFLPGDSAEYYLSIIRFSIQTGSELPIWIPRIQIGQQDVDLTVYAVSIDFNGTVSTQFLRWIPWNNSPLPNPPLLNQDNSTRYYYMSSFTQFVEMVNNALSLAWNVVGSAINDAPFLDFDPVSNRFKLNADVNYVSGNPAPVKIYFNTRLFQLLSTFPAKFAGNEGELNYQLEFYNNNNINLKPIFQPSGITNCQKILYQALVLYQEIDTLNLFNPVASIVFCSNLLPIKATNTSAPILFNDNSTGMSSSGAANLANILTDFELGVSVSNQYRPFVSYVANGIYRLVDLNSMANLNRIDLFVFWKTQTGDLIPFRLQPGCSAHVKIMFRNKSFNDEK